MKRTQIGHRQLISPPMFKFIVALTIFVSAHMLLMKSYLKASCKGVIHPSDTNMGQQLEFDMGSFAAPEKKVIATVFFGGRFMLKMISVGRSMCGEISFSCSLQHR
jgi:hypothetical protein